MNEIIKRVIAISNEDVTLLDAIAIVSEEQDISSEDMAAIVKDDKTLMSMLESECRQRGMFKNCTEKLTDINEVF